jgi:gas vesicle protein
MNRFYRFFQGFLMGVLLGGGLALLLTPYSGDQMRDEITNYYQKSLDDIKQATLQRREEMQKQLEALRSAKKE